MSDPNDAEELFDPASKRADETDAFLDKPPNASDPKALKEKALTDKARELHEENDIKAILSTEEGVRFIARLVSACGWNQPHFHPQNSVMCEIAGRRSIGQQVENWISNADLALWFRVRSRLELSRAKPKTSTR